MFKPANRSSIVVRAKQVYGTTLYYPVCTNAFDFTRISNSETLTPKILKLIQRLGFDVELEDTAALELKQVLKKDD